MGTSSSVPAKKRSYGLDLMRILMTLFVCAIHTIYKGGLSGAVADSPKKRAIIIFLEFAVSCAVNGFAVISGYVGINSKFRLSRIAGLYFTVSFYNIVIPVIFHFTSGYVIDKVVLLRAVFPFAYDANWYFTAYFGMFFLIPFMNAAIKHVDRKQCNIALLAIMTVFAVIPTGLYLWFKDGYDINIFNLSCGYSTLWIAVLYLVGAAIREYDLFRKVPKIAWLGCYIGATFFGTAYALVRTFALDKEFTPLSAYNSPIIVIQAIGLLMFFKDLKLPKAADKIIGFIAPHTFSIYIIHTQDALWLLWLMGRYAPDGERRTIILPFIFCWRVVSLFTLCMIGDMPLHYCMKYFPKLFKKAEASKA